MSGRLWELYTGNCPPERSCDKITVARYQALYDAEATWRRKLRFRWGVRLRVFLRTTLVQRVVLFLFVARRKVMSVLGIPPCSCPDPALCERLGQHVHGRMYELYTGDCPPERPCPPEQSAAYRRLLDGDAEAVKTGRPPPSLSQQVMGFTNAMARWVAAGRPRPTAEQLAERQTICRTCVHRVVEGDIELCGLCGCHLAGEPILLGMMERPGKAEMSTEICPHNPPKWPKLV